MSETPTTTVGERRQALRVNAGLAPETLADTARISLGTIKKAEAGGMLQERVIRAIAEALGCTACEYLG